MIALCRSRRELSNACLLAKFGFDTTENEPSKVCPIPRGAANSADWPGPIGRTHGREVEDRRRDFRARTVPPPEPPSRKF